MITIDHVSRSYGDVRALDDVSIQVGRGEIFGVVGQSGAGKSTLLRLVNAIERPDSGSVVVDDVELSALQGRELRAARHRIGMVFQHFNLVGNRTAAQNVEFALEAVGRTRGDRKREARDMLDLVGLAHRADAYPSELSGGQRQRVGIARALASKPDVLLSDEATSALDPETTRQILALVQRLSADLGLTVLLITHEMEVVKQICDGAALLESGRVVEQGPLLDLVNTPGSRLAHDLFPLGEAPDLPGFGILDLTFAGGEAERPTIALLARDLGLDVSILGATIETIGGQQAGRTRLAIPGGGEATAQAVTFLAERGVRAEAVSSR
ncbi:methionine ABC transporter ATP-binding protein [Agromyces seonyuensis]|uniref:ATP-binding cassette domain-containing protein n=1 Tax=Agromyces seonyuensis TaxID=2662446 RepID=A0A6I4P7M7_9MICO|nr:ATP-binding cassette domain-containing protein [Agromyces seonyuensis]MWB99807.1 ATP-binding cassette domain-containing protein [Agromyces seonyuensis]